MNTTPRLNHKGFVGDLTNEGCGILAMRNVEQYFWQSRATLVGRPADLPELTDIRELAGKIRAHFNNPVL